MKSAIATLLFALSFVSPSMAADLKDDLLAMEKTSWTAWGKHDVKTFGDLMSTEAVSISADGDVGMGRDKILAAVGSHTCTLKDVDFSDASVRQPTSDVAILTYTAIEDVTCAEGKLARKIIATAVYVRQGGKWRWANYQETALK